MALVQTFTASTGLPNQIELSWLQPLGFNTTDSEIIITRTSDHFPMELYNSSFPNTATDIIPVELFRGQTIAGVVAGNVSVVGTVLTDSGASFPTSPSLNGRLLRDATGALFRILSSTSTSVTLNATPVAGVYCILPDFPTTIRDAESFEQDIRTISGPGVISNLVQFINGTLTVIQFTPDELVNLIFKDGAGNKFVVKTNTTNTITFFGTNTPIVGNGLSLLSSSVNNQTYRFIDSFKTTLEASTKAGTGLLNDQFYYYTAFTKVVGANVAQAEFATYDSTATTQTTSISTKDYGLGARLYSYWPSIFRELDATGDLEDLMNVFEFQFRQIYSLINTFRLQDSDLVFVNALVALADQTGLPSVGYSIGSDTMRRIAKDMLTAWKLKGSKQGIALFIKIITTWDITGGTGLINDAISDYLPNVSAFRFFASSLGSTNVRFSQTNAVSDTNSSGITSVITSPFVPGGRFPKSLPGIIIPGFFTFREFVVNLPNVALYIGTTSAFVTGSGSTIITDSVANFGANDSLVGTFMLPNESEPNDLFLVTANTVNTITVKGIVSNKEVGGSYAVLSPLNANRFSILNKLMPKYQPFGTEAAFRFI